MSDANLRIPQPANEPIFSYAPGSPERASLKAALSQVAGEQVDIPLFINGEEVRTGRTTEVRMPHAHKHVLGTYHLGDSSHVGQAIDAAMAAKKSWSQMPFHERAAIFLRAADLLATRYRAVHQRGHHARAVEDRLPGGDRRRLRADRLPALQRPLRRASCCPSSRSRRRRRGTRWTTGPLDGFVFAASPFNFTAIGGNLPTAPALMGNVVL